jgi:hypothetical protein
MKKEQKKISVITEYIDLENTNRSDYANKRLRTKFGVIKRNVKIKKSK